MTHLSKERDTIRREMLRIKNKPKIGNSKEENLNKLKTKPALGSTSKIIDDPLITKVKKKIFTELIPKPEGLLSRESRSRVRDTVQDEYMTQTMGDSRRCQNETSNMMIAKKLLM